MQRRRIQTQGLSSNKHCLSGAQGHLEPSVFVILQLRVRECVMSTYYKLGVFYKISSHHKIIVIAFLKIDKLRLRVYVVCPKDILPGRSTACT